MAIRTVILDSQGQTLEVTVPEIENLIEEGMVKHTHSHYGGDLADANVYLVDPDYEQQYGAKAAIHRIETLAGASALSEVQSVPLAGSSNGHRFPSESETAEVYCERCGLHVSEWPLKKCTGRTSNVMVRKS